jgi:hypothetical protein
MACLEKAAEVYLVGFGLLGSGFLLWLLSTFFARIAFVQTVGHHAARFLRFLLSQIKFGHIDNGGWIVISIFGLLGVLTCCALFVEYVIKGLDVMWASLGLIYTLVCAGAACIIWGVPAFRMTVWPWIAGALAFVASTISYEAGAGLLATFTGGVVYRYTAVSPASLALALMTLITGIAEAALATHEHLSSRDSVAGLAIYMATMFLFGLSISRELSEHWHVKVLMIPVSTAPSQRSQSLLTSLNLH